MRALKRRSTTYVLVTDTMAFWKGMPFRERSYAAYRYPLRAGVTSEQIIPAMWEENTMRYRSLFPRKVRTPFSRYAMRRLFRR